MLQTITENSDTELYTHAAAWIVESIAAICAHQGYCVLGIVGGRSIPGLLQAILPHAPEIKGTIHVFWLDDRISDEKNYTSATPYFEQLQTAGVALHWYPLKGTDKFHIEQEAAQILEKLVDIKGRAEFDIIITSAGEDGHVASLFPHHPVLHAQGKGYAILDGAPKPPSLRVTVTPELLLTAKEAYLFFIGDKHEVYTMFSDPHISWQECPAKLLQTIPKLTVLTCLR